MLSVFICEDNPQQRERMKTIVKDYIALKDYDMKMTLAADNPETLIDFVCNNPVQGSLYILDVDLQHEMNGIVLASKIREMDLYGKIVFVTTHSELAYLTFKYKVEAMSYVVKDDPAKIMSEVHECIDLAYKRYQDGYQKKELFQVKIGDEVKNIPFDDIMFFESSHTPHKVILHTDNGYIEFYGALSSVEESGEHLYRCHQSFVVNTKNIISVNKSKREVEMKSGEIVFVTVRKMKRLLEIMNQQV